MVNYPKWLANVILVPKKDRRVRMCVDFQDLNIVGPVLLSFMDGFSRYNQIKIASKDMEKTSFITL